MCLVRFVLAVKFWVYLYNMVGNKKTYIVIYAYTFTKKLTIKTAATRLKKPN